MALAWTVAALTMLSAIFEILEWQGAVDLGAIELDGLSLVASLVYLVHFLTYLASIVAISMWIHRAHRRIHAAGIEGLEYTPGWAVGWFFIPFANLIKPLQAMRELWNASHRIAYDFAEGTPSLLKAWWGFWLVGNISSNVGMRMTLSDAPEAMQAGLLLGALGSLLTMLAAVLVARIISEVSEAQESGSFNAQAFA